MISPDVACRFVSLPPDHIYPSGGFSLDRVNWVKLVQAPDNIDIPMRFSCLSKFVCVVLETSMFFSGKGLRVKFGSRFNVMAVYEVSWHGPEIIYRFTGIRNWVVRLWKRPFWFSKKVNVTFSSNWSLPFNLDVFRSWSPPRCLIRPFAIGIMKFSFFAEISPLSHWVFSSRLLMCPSFPTPQCLQPLFHPSKFTPRTERIRRTIQVRLSFQIDGFLVFRRDGVILNHWTKRNNWSLKWFFKSSFIGRLPIR